MRIEEVGVRKGRSRGKKGGEREIGREEGWGVKETEREGKEERGGWITEERVGCLSIGASVGWERTDIRVKNWEREFWLARKVGGGEGCLAEICDVPKEVVQRGRLMLRTELNCREVRAGTEPGDFYVDGQHAQSWLWIAGRRYAIIRTVLYGETLGAVRSRTGILRAIATPLS